MTARQYPAKPKDVYLFATCLVDLFDPYAGVAAVELLESQGLTVHVPEDQTCCGQPAYTSGYPDEARSVARKQLSLFPEDWPVIVPSGSCAGMMRHHYPELFLGLPESSLVRGLSERIFELSEFLVEVCQFRVDPKTMPQPTRVVLHTSCSARREMGTHLSARALLNRFPGVEIVEQVRESECCGFGGAFSVRHPHISAAIAGEKVDALLATGADALVSADCGCLMNLNGTLAKRGERMRGQHIASFLNERIQGTGGALR